MHDAKLTSLSKIEIGQTILVVANQQQPRLFGRPKDPTAIPLRVTAKGFAPDQWSGKVWTLTLNDDTKTEPRYGTTHVYVVHSTAGTPDQGGSEADVPMPDGDTRRVKVLADGTITVPDWKGGEREETTASGRKIRIADDGVVTVLSDAEADARMAEPATAEDQAAANSDRCGQCKGFGVVRKRGSQAGKSYRTLAGSEAAQANGNSETCPVCKGATLLLRTA